MTDYDRSLIEGLRRDIRNSRSCKPSTEPKGVIDMVVVIGFSILMVKLLLKLAAAIAGLA